MNFSNHILTTVLTLNVLSMPVCAQIQEDESEDIYQIEIVVFRHASSEDPAYLSPGQPDTSDAIDLFPTPGPLDNLTELLEEKAPRRAVFGDAAANLNLLRHQSVPGPMMLELEDPSPIVALEPEELQLSDAWRRLERNRSYQPLVHLGWRQPASPFGDAIPIRIHGGAVIIEAAGRSAFAPFAELEPSIENQKAVEELEGNIAFERGRFLHLRIDLALRVLSEASTLSNNSLSPLADNPLGNSSDQPYRIYRLTERRQIRTASLNYFDHRRFGLIARVDKWEPIEEDPPLGDDLLLEQQP